MADDELPTDPFTELAASAVQLHELYLSWVDAGFTEAQAMELTNTTLGTSISAAIFTRRNDNDTPG
jgi:hypothetical protein